MKLSLEAIELPPGSGRGNLSSRLVFTGERWKALNVCVHGHRLRCRCMECIDYSNAGEKSKGKKQRSQLNNRA
jgi:hypothetical protein